MAQDATAAPDLHNNGSSKPVSFFSVKPQLLVQAPKAADAVQFYKSAFGAEEVNRSTYPKRKAEQDLPHILCAELKLGSSVFFVCDQTEESPASAKADGSGYVLRLETDDVDSAVAKTVNAGAVKEGEITDDESGCCGGRVGKVKDPYGYVWLISTPAKESGDVAA